ncbi:peptidoglycan DD-metalloendopeptidase family protein [Terrimonas sp. NA20]|uniref:Peptidoglycan DD-metalloendopeptidase family protein n=1 Tax=Terrimonas ginsenosidimutans TaxID=2908004 RepID=A0ABS9KQT4_9BACT|nr:peptidoglycan DD-metalloendopeptidase family protein [Terrimonas ginsenosidimutans]MCG2614672.1 peptidoglycan DD-metalloendopeptidase family protein [Terrimonas ginsenosidimutans]
MKKRNLLTTLFFFASIGFAVAQTSKEELERERKDIQSELKEIQDAYNRVKKEGNQSLAQLNMVKRKMILQERLISTSNKELRAIDDDMYLSNLEIYRLQKQLDTLKSQYAKTVVYAYKNRSSFNYVNFIFSATSFNDAVRRISYLKSYRAYRERQVVTINETQELIEKRQQQQLVRKQQKNETLKAQTQERTELVEQRKEKDEVVAGFKSKEKVLQTQIANKKKRDRDIQNAIAAIIRREIEAAKKEEAARIAAAKKAAAEEKAKPVTATPTPNKPAANNNTSTASAGPSTERKSTSYLELNEKDVELGTDFGNNRGKLPWPVDNGFVSIPFGPYTIEGTNLRDDNPGLTIGTRSGAVVKAVFDGVVSAVHNYGDGAAIIIRHGKYYTSYANLSGVNVSKGATVKRGQTIGKAGDSDDGSNGRVDFMLMIESKNVNPQQWLRR